MYVLVSSSHEWVIYHSRCYLPSLAHFECGTGCSQLFASLMLHTASQTPYLFQAPTHSRYSYLSPGTILHKASLKLMMTEAHTCPTQHRASTIEIHVGHEHRRKLHTVKE
jgi:hypothetical protein